jgi:sugar phosphate isomerase/epimerase
MLLGNAAAPRWWDQEPRRLDQYLDFLAGAGATSIELALHHGPIDARGARVHVVEENWLTVASKARERGLACQFHASLDRRFDVARWRADRGGLMREFAPIIEAVKRMSDKQSSSAEFVVHATSSATPPNDDGGEDAKGFLDWAADSLAGANVVVCPELRPARDENDRRWDRSRASMTGLMVGLARPNTGICWDLAHDWENRRFDPEWSEKPSGSFLDLVRHVHLHDAGADGTLHHPLVGGRVPWAEQLRLLRSRGYSGAATMEIRYRYALAAGEPWTVLAASYRRALEAIAPD